MVAQARAKQAWPPTTSGLEWSLRPCGRAQDWVIAALNTGGVVNHMIRPLQDGEGTVAQQRQ
jgi:hypothetical protein